MWERIEGFTSPGEYERFRTFIEGQVKDGIARECAPDTNYRKGMIYGGQWFEHLPSGKTWRLVAPDFPFKGLWEEVEY